MDTLEWTFLGRVDVSTGLRLQAAQAEKVARDQAPRLFLLEHPPTITLGRSARRSNLRLSEAEYTRRGMEVVRVLRGGDVTYHGPGQLVGYPVVNLDRLHCSVPEWVGGICDALIAVLAQLGVQARWSDVHPGVWVGQEKIAAVGFRISRRISTHGFALNLNPDLSHFETIVPCGLPDLGVTSLERLGCTVLDMRDVAGLVAGQIAARFGWRLGPAIEAQQVLREGADDLAVSVVS
jgi:lipoate-protein ligase B